MEGIASDQRQLSCWQCMRLDSRHRDTAGISRGTVLK
jgi:hypothetical protein